MSTSSNLALLSQRQREQGAVPDSRFKTGGELGESPSPSQGFFTHISTGAKMLPKGAAQLSRENPEQKKKIEALFSMRRQFLSNDIRSLLQSICDHVELRCAKTKWSFDYNVAYSATALSVRDRMIELWNDTNRHFHEKQPKRLYYLSIEFLIGRLLRSNMLSLGAMNEYTEALSQIGLDMEEVVEQEEDMALGNGGLGRLAACFLDSMATLRLPAWGYGLRYMYGMFRQRVSEQGHQLELPDYWLENGCPWEIQRNDVKVRVRFYGNVREQKHYEKRERKNVERRLKTKGSDQSSGKKGDVWGGSSNSQAAPLPRSALSSDVEKKDDTQDYEDVETVEYVDVEVGPPQIIWENGEEVVGKAYDVPIAGYHTLNMINLRLWESVPSNEFDFESFNRGGYDDAVKGKQNAETITQVLYPNDAFHAGKELRLKQQYFFVSSTLQDILRRFEGQFKGTPIFSHLTQQDSSQQNIKIPWEQLPDYIVMQCNDTHPVLAIPELLRLLIDTKGLTFEEAWNIVQKCFAYTNHTVLPEALEKWPVDLLGRLLPRHLQIIYQINFVFLESIKDKYPNDIASLSIVEEWPVKSIRMANLAIVTATFVNGVAELHSDLLKKTIFSNFFKVFPNKFLNVTNGVTQRRWLLESNPELAKIYDQYVGTKWTVSYRVLKRLEPVIQDDTKNETLLQQFWSARRIAKEKLAEVIKNDCGVEIQNIEGTIFDVHVKRLHEYKRQSLNILRCIAQYLELKSIGTQACANAVPRVVIFGGKAAPGYYMAKKTIQLINCVGNVVNNDESIANALKVVFVPNYNVSLAQIIIPAADISEQISTAGYEASGTSCMKFCMNGALLVGTWDGANIEIREEIGDEQVFMFGLITEEISTARQHRFSQEFNMDNHLDGALRAIETGMFGNGDEFTAFTDSIRHKDHYLVASDFQQFYDLHKLIEDEWKDRDGWAKKALLTSVRMEKFSSDRSIIDYSEKIWGIKPCIVPSPVRDTTPSGPVSISTSGGSGVSAVSYGGAQAPSAAPILGSGGPNPQQRAGPGGAPGAGQGQRRPKQGKNL